MFESLGDAIEAERQKLEVQLSWLKSFRDLMLEKHILDHPWEEKELIIPVSKSISKFTKIAGVDGGVIGEEMTGFDLILFRAVGTIFHGIGKQVKAEYVPNFDPDPQVFFSKSLSSRQEFSRVSTLMRLFEEYQTARRTIEQENPTVVFIDGRVGPLGSDFLNSHSGTKVLEQAENDVKRVYEKLIFSAEEHGVLLCGVVKDSRSAEVVKHLGKTIPKLIRSKKLNSSDVSGWRTTISDMQDNILASELLKEGERLAWINRGKPGWLNADVQIWHTLIRPLKDDLPIRVEIVVPGSGDYPAAADIALAAVVKLCQHGLPIAIPTILIEADERTKLTQDHLNVVVDQIAISLGMTRDQLRKRRYFRQGLSYL